MLYILCGTIIAHGFQDKMEAIFDEIQRSNMSKLDLNGKPIYREDGKVMKGPNYFKPNLKKIIEEDYTSAFLQLKGSSDLLYWIAISEVFSSSATGVSLGNLKVSP